MRVKELKAILDGVDENGLVFIAIYSPEDFEDAFNLEDDNEFNINQYYIRIIYS